jgi:uncharacterized membrane protein (UPF0127 family)
MEWRRTANYTALVLVLAAVALLVLQPPLWLVSTGEYGNATVTAVDGDGTAVAAVDVRIANTTAQKRVGLSRTDFLPQGTGMLFVFDDEAVRHFHMKNTSIPLDMVFVAANGTVTTVHHAPVPEDTPSADLRRYSGRAKWVLEVDRGWANRTGVGVGDRIEIPEHVD